MGATAEAAMHPALEQALLAVAQPHLPVPLLGAGCWGSLGDPGAWLMLVEGTSKETWM